MKFSLSLAVLAVVASQAMAVVPIPVKECTKTVVVQPTDTGCEAFATANGCTFADMLKWNQKLRPDCLNLDVGHPICVSVTPGAGNNTTAPAVPTTTGAATSAPVATSTRASNTTAAATSAATSAGAGATTTPSAPKATQPSSANGNKASVLLGAAGVLLSAIYML